jgi:hypothetical protein
MPTPNDLARIDARLQQFWREYGALVDWSLCALLLACIAFCAGYLLGQGAR